MEKLICLFNNKATKNDLMTTNGDFILNPICTSSIISEKTNEDYSNQFIFRLDKEYEKEINALVEDNVIRVQDEEGEECFRIVNVTKNTKTIDVFTVHITIRDIINMWLEDVRPTNLSGNGAINWIFDNAKGGHAFNVTSNIATLNSANYQSMSVYNALYGADNSFIVKWGGETRRRGFNIAINDKIGIDRGMQIRSKKNITGFESKTNLDQLCTCLYVKGFDGIKLDSPINSPLINNYSKPYFKEIKYEDIKVKNENNDEGYSTLAEAQAEMLRRGKEQFEKGNIDIIKATYTLKFAQLEKTEEYKEYSMIETAFLGDTVTVIEDNYNVNIKVRVIARKFDVLKQERIETTLSNMDLKDKPVKIEDIIKDLEDELSGETRPNLGDYINNMINAGMKDSHVVLKPNELLIMDSKDINTAINVCRYNKNGLGFSQTGYFGYYEYGFTIDGKINASMISTGVLLADLIKAGMLKSFNNKTWINMDNGTFNFADKIKFDGNNFDIDLSSKGLATDGQITDLQTQITANSKGLTTKVSSGQGFSTEFNQNSESFNFNLGNNSMNVWMTKYGLDIKNGNLNVWDGSGRKVFGASGDGVMFSGRLQPFDNIIRLFGNDCLLDGSANALRRVFSKGIYDSVDSAGYWRLFNQYSNNGTRYASIGYESDGHLSFYNNSSRLKMLYGTAWLQCRNTGDNAFVPITSSNFDVSSKKEFKTNITEPTVNFKNVLMDSKIEQYNYKSEVEALAKTRSLESPDLQIGLILEDLTEEAREVLHTKGGAGISLYTMISVLWKTCQDQELRIQKLEGVK